MEDRIAKKISMFSIFWMKLIGVILKKSTEKMMSLCEGFVNKL